VPAASGFVSEEGKVGSVSSGGGAEMASAGGGKHGESDDWLTLCHTPGQRLHRGDAGTLRKALREKIKT
jgi:hypothetical protein